MELIILIIILTYFNRITISVINMGPIGCLEILLAGVKFSMREEYPKRTLTGWDHVRLHPHKMIVRGGRWDL